MNAEQRAGRSGPDNMAVSRAGYDELPAIDLGPCTHLDALLHSVGDVNSREIVDLGCGEGQFGKELAKRGARVTGVDPLMAPVERQYLESGTFRLLRAGAQAVPLPAASVDLVTFIFSLHHMPEGALANCLGEAVRLLRPSGHLYVAEPLAEGPFHHLTAPFHDETEVRANALRALQQLRPKFKWTRNCRYLDRRFFPDFSAFARRMTANTRFNDYDVQEVTNPLVVARFNELFVKNGGNFDQPVEVNVFSHPIGS